MAWGLARQGDPVLRRFAIGIAAVSLAQVASGLSNVVLGWPLAAALAHSAGAAALVLLLALLLARALGHAAASPRTAGAAMAAA